MPRDTSAHVGRVAVRLSFPVIVVTTISDYSGEHCCRHVTGVLGLAAQQRKIHSHVGFDFDRLSVENVRSIAPLLNRFDGSFD